MVHKINPKGKSVPVKHAGFHKLFVEWKSSGNSDSPSKNADKFYSEVEDEAKDFIDQFENGQMTADELREKLDGIANDKMQADYDDDPATVYYDGSDEPNTIGEFHDYTDGDFDIKWHSTDAWRGYYDVIPSKKWKLLNSDNILSMSEDAENLKKFDDELQTALKQKGIHYARVFTRSSNVFSTGLDMFVEKSKAKEVTGLAKSLAKKYRNPDDYNLTALTGANPSDATKEDKMLVEAVKELDKGATPQEAVRKVLKRSK